MKNTTHRVVILSNVNSALISQAILILKDGASACDGGVMEEAERIVERYMNTAPVSHTEHKRKFPVFQAALIGLAVSCIMLILRFVR